MWKNLKNSKKGITLIALVITIVILLILASVSIAMLTGDNGILTRAGDAKIETALGTVKEQVRLYQIEKKMNEEEVTAESLLAEGKVSRTVQAGEEDKYYMYYALKENSFEGMQELGKGNIASLKDVFLIDDNLNVKYIASNGKEYGNSLNNKVLEDETEIKFSSKAFSEYVSKISGVTEDEMKFKWMKNQTSLVISDQNIDNLQDLVFFPNLKSLILDRIQVNNLNGIENCTKLNSLSIKEGTNKEYYAVKELQNLETFFRSGCSDYNNIIESLKYCKKLKNFTIQNQRIIDMSNIKELENLKILNLSNCKVEEIAGLEKKLKLEDLTLNDNKISKIEGIEKLLNLKRLNLINNNIIDITPLSQNTSLTYVNLKGNAEIDGNRNNYTGEKLSALNKIEEIIEKGGSIELDIDKLGLFKNYTKLNLSRQNLITLEGLEAQDKLKELNLDYNKLTLEDEKSQEILKNMKNLNYLSLANNQITNITIINDLINLKELNVIGNNINLKEIENIISNLSNLRVSTNSLKTIETCDVNKIIKLNLNTSGLEEIPNLQKFNKLTHLNLNNNPKISNLYKVSQIPNLESLILSNNNLHGRMIEFSKLTKLTKLDLRGNTLWSEDLEKLKILKNNTNLTINLSDNSIIDATALLELDSSTKINLSNNLNLSQDSKDKLKAKFGNNVTF